MNSISTYLRVFGLIAFLLFSGFIMHLIESLIGPVIGPVGFILLMFSFVFYAYYPVIKDMQELKQMYEKGEITKAKHESIKEEMAEFAKVFIPP